VEAILENDTEKVEELKVKRNTWGNYVSRLIGSPLKSIVDISHDIFNRFGFRSKL
jgi:hypothetical protein